MDANDRIGADLWHALTTGTTLKIRFVLALHSIVLGLQLTLGIADPRAVPLADKWVLLATMSAPVWATALLASGSIMLWRVLSTQPRTWAAWASNLLAFLTWAMICLSYVAVDGWRGLLGSYTVALLMAAFCVLRTESTHRDQETA